MIKKLILGFITGLLVVSIAFLGVAEVTGNGIINNTGNANPVAGFLLKAVVLPISSATTNNAKTKTCISNQREIVSQINNYYMTYNTYENGAIEIYSDGECAYEVWSDMYYLDEYEFGNLFYEMPYCPSGGMYYVNVSYDEYNYQLNVDVYCDCHGSY